MYFSNVRATYKIKYNIDQKLSGNLTSQNVIFKDYKALNVKISPLKG